MQPTLKVNVVSITLQRDPRGEGQFQEIKLVRSKAGKQRWVVTKPLRFAGRECVDDGERQLMYFPDRRQLTDQQSAAKAPCDAPEKIALAKRNYTFQIASRETIAGRNTVCVTAIPRNPDLLVRNYFIDEEAAYPLRVETVGTDGRANVMFDTKFIEYPAKLPNSVFKLSAVLGNVHKITYNPPETMSRIKARAMVGFVPLIPNGLPMGFKVQELQYNPGSEWKSVMVRLTDGLARATVYQWKGQDIEFPDSTPGEYNGIKLLIVSDLGPKVRQKLLQTFVSQATSDEAKALRIYGSRHRSEWDLPIYMEPRRIGEALSEIDRFFESTALPRANTES
ncbi:hypothetical protein OP10G_1576 [Fimbriimonas ginsengisoli Gsoil 348]|uniref:MucB/RseB N-terminal domain-containing protein n=2 Tax=Fimbriimonas ginsengisoli TaxID=1005039 RepID=A0A068NTK5_FIMGI|nr:hypothetical protein OP10G_1576 [Fimbriimonas ginsengisoli Gsoil 348]